MEAGHAMHPEDKLGQGLGAAASSMLDCLRFCFRLLGMMAELRAEGNERAQVSSFIIEHALADMQTASRTRS